MIATVATAIDMCSIVTAIVSTWWRCACLSLAYSYTIPGFNPATDTLTSASLTLQFYDDTAKGDPGTNGQPETVDITLDGLLVGDEVTITDVSLASGPFSPSFDVRAKLADNGTLNIFLELGDNNAGNNDFFFAASRLVATGETGGTTPPSSAPEPATLALFGFAAAVGLRRRWTAGRGRAL